MAEKKNASTKQEQAPEKGAANAATDVVKALGWMSQQNEILINMNVDILKHLEYATLQKRADLLSYTDKAAAKELKKMAENLFSVPAEESEDAENSEDTADSSSDD